MCKERLLSIYHLSLYHLSVKKEIRRLYSFLESSLIRYLPSMSGGSHGFHMHSGSGSVSVRWEAEEPALFPINLREADDHPHRLFVLFNERKHSFSLYCQPLSVDKAKAKVNI